MVEAGRTERKSPGINPETNRQLEAILGTNPQSKINRGIKAVKGRETSPLSLNKEPQKLVMGVGKKDT